MVKPTLQEFLYFIGSLIVSIGGASVIIIALSKWFGQFMANRLLQGQKFRHETELEQIKSKYSAELELTKAKLERSKSQFLRYSEKQFELYNALWRVLWDLKKKADELWEFADPKELPNLSKKIALVKDAMNINILIIEEEHFDRLTALIDEFEKFNFGKKKLVELRNKSAHDVEGLGIDKHLVRQIISQNELVKERYEQLIRDLAQSFKQQIRG